MSDEIDVDPYQDTAEVLIGSGYECEAITMTAQEIEDAAERMLAAARHLRARAATRDRMTNHDPRRHRVPRTVWTDRNDPDGFARSLEWSHKQMVRLLEQERYSSLMRLMYGAGEE